MSASGCSVALLVGELLTPQIWKGYFGLVQGNILGDSVSLSFGVGGN